MMHKDSTDVAEDLRTLADRLEDDEYLITGFSVRPPSRDMEGELSFTVDTVERYERMAAVFVEDVEVDDES